MIYEGRSIILTYNREIDNIAAKIRVRPDILIHKRLLYWEFLVVFPSIIWQLLTPCFSFELLRINVLSAHPTSFNSLWQYIIWTLVGCIAINYCLHATYAKTSWFPLIFPSISRSISFWKGTNNRNLLTKSMKFKIFKTICLRSHYLYQFFEIRIPIA